MVAAGLTHCLFGSETSMVPFSEKLILFFRTQSPEGTLACSCSCLNKMLGSPFTLSVERRKICYQEVSDSWT